VSLVVIYPLKFIDPSGYCSTDPYDEYYDYECYQLAEEISEEFNESYEWLISLDYDQLIALQEAYMNRPDDMDWMSLFDYLLWETIPSAVGWKISSISAQAGLGVEGEVTIIEYAIVFNWRSGELSFVYGSGGNWYIGTPTGVGGETSFGPMLIYGASTNDALQGLDAFAEVSLGADAFAVFGGNITGSRSINHDKTGWAIDEMSGRTIDVEEINLSVGANLRPNAIEFGVGWGLIWSKVIEIFDLY
jgi:hypothetical protein